MLARPQQYERSVDRCLVAAEGSLADALEQPAAAVGVADVRRWHRAGVHERVPERDVPRLERVELTVEVPSAALESGVAIRHPAEHLERMRSAADAGHAANQRGGVF